MGLDNYSGCYLDVSGKDNMAVPLLGKVSFCFVLFCLIMNKREKVYMGIWESPKQAEREADWAWSELFVRGGRQTAEMTGKVLAFIKRGKPGEFSMDFAMCKSCEKGLRKPGGQPSATGKGNDSFGR